MGLGRSKSANSAGFRPRSGTYPAAASFVAFIACLRGFSGLRVFLRAAVVVALLVVLAPRSGAFRGGGGSAFFGRMKADRSSAVSPFWFGGCFSRLFERVWFGRFLFVAFAACQIGSDAILAGGFGRRLLVRGDGGIAWFMPQMPFGSSADAASKPATGAGVFVGEERDAGGSAGDVNE